MKSKLNLKHLNFLIGVLFLHLFILLICCAENEKKDIYNHSNEISFLTATDSLIFNYFSDSWKNSNSNYSDNRYGHNLFVDSNGVFIYVSIDSDNKFHKFNFSSSQHTYSEKVCTGNIEAYKVDSSFIYVLCDSVFYIKNHELQTLDSFNYKPPKISKEHGIDFSVENNSNLFKTSDYFVLMYYIVDEMIDGTSLYRNSDSLFYFFNPDTTFFASQGCLNKDTSFHYFRYPVVTSDDKYLYHANRVSNCISKSSNDSTIIISEINSDRANYLSINHADQYEISKLRRYRFSTHYNKELLLFGNHIYLIKEIPYRIYMEDNIRTYEHILEIKKFDTRLNVVKTVYIRDKSYSLAYVKKGELYLFDMNKNKALVYEI